VDARSVLVSARRSAEISQRKLSRRSGIPQAAISRIERGEVSPRVSTLDRLLRGCDRDLELVQRAGFGVDRSLIRERLHLSMGERARLAAREWENTRRLFDRAVRR